MTVLVVFSRNDSFTLASPLGRRLSSFTTVRASGGSSRCVWEEVREGTRATYRSGGSGDYTALHPGTTPRSPRRTMAAARRSSARTSCSSSSRRGWISPGLKISKHSGWQALEPPDLIFSVKFRQVRSV